ncbi:MAG: hypothetical protein LBB89_03005 [Treponema sp.]|jgi:hypothetical protein|nr:hypothetical protein [Treponema sp.]
MIIMEQTLSSTRLEQLRKRINDQDYMYAAIQRIALVLSNELIDMSPGGGSHNERQWQWQWKGRR